MHVNKDWSEREIAVTQVLRRAGFYVRDIKEVFDLLGWGWRTAKAISIKCERDEKIVFGEEAIDFSALLPEEAKIVRLVSERAELLEKAEEEEEEVSLSRSKQLSFFKEGITLLKELSKNSYRPKPAPRLTPSEKISHLLILSDTHYGAKETDPSTGEVVYDPQACEERVRSIPDLLLDRLKQIGAKPQDSHSLAIALGGDMLDGESIYPTHDHHIALPVIGQLKGFTTAIWSTLLDLRTMFPRVYLIAVAGNHGRMSKTAHEMSNWDNALYLQLEIMAHIENDPRFHVSVSRGNYMNFAVNGWRGHMRHEGVPHDGTAAMRAKLGSWKDAHQFDFMICGHYHHPGILDYNGKKIYRNGSMKGFDDFADGLGKHGRAAQLLIGMTKSERQLYTTELNW